MKKLKLFSMFAAATLLFTACSSDDDNGEEPQIDPPLVTLEDPENGAHFHLGDRIHVDGEVHGTDLSELRIDIHWAGDGHGHGKKADDPDNQWHQEWVIELSGNNEHFHEHIDIPEDIAEGEHHLIVDALDNAGNRSERVEISIYIEEDDHDDHGDNGDGKAPELTLTSPTQSDLDHAHGGDVIEIKGEADGNGVDIKDLHIELIDEDNGNVVDDVHEHDINQETYNIDATVQVPNTNHGHYKLIIEVENADHQKSEKEFYIDLGH